MDSHLTRSQSNTHGNSMVALMAILLAVSMFTAAGFWQLHRARHKDGLNAKVEAAMKGAVIELSVSEVRIDDVEFHTVRVSGEWVTDKTIFIDNKIHNHVVGYHVVTPLRIASGNRYVLVNRGWVKAPALRRELPVVSPPAGTVEISGIARAPSNRFLELDKQSTEGVQERVWQNLTIERFRAWSRLELQPVVVFQQNASDDKLQRVSVAPEAAGLSADRHRGYALTWFGLAVVTLALGLAAKCQSQKDKLA